MNTMLDAVLELQQLRMCARWSRKSGDKLIAHAAYVSARLLCQEIRAGKIDPARGNLHNPYRVLIPGA